MANAYQHRGRSRRRCDAVHDREQCAVLLGVDPFWEMALAGLLIELVVYLDNMQKRRRSGV
jgi:predicted ABC-type sugar transport system permease subunit